MRISGAEIVLTVDEVEIDAVGIVLGTDGRHLLDELLHVSPVRRHGRRVVDDEHGVKAPQPVEGLLVDTFGSRHCVILCCFWDEMGGVSLDFRVVVEGECDNAMSSVNKEKHHSMVRIRRAFSIPCLPHPRPSSPRHLACNLLLWDAQSKSAPLTPLPLKFWSSVGSGVHCPVLYIPGHVSLGNIMATRALGARICIGIGSH